MPKLPLFVVLAALLVVAPAAGAATHLPALQVTSPSGAPGTDADFGDAPDGNPTGYGSGASVGSFPSLLKSDGAEHASTAHEWLGPRVDTETDSKQVNGEAFDDGVQELSLAECGPSSLTVQVSVADREAPDHPYGDNPEQTLSLNALFDWNQDGLWGGGDGCAPEWSVQNLPVDTSQWPPGETSQLVTAAFTGGAQVSELWYRVTLTYGQQVSNWDGRGKFAFGETEDYLLGPTPTPTAVPSIAYFEVACSPNPLNMSHGTSSFVQLVQTAGPGVPTEWEVTAVRSPQGTTDPPINEPAVGDIPSTSLPGTITFTSTAMDLPPRSERHVLELTARNEGWTATVECDVIVTHEGGGAGQPPPATPMPPGTPTPTPATIQTGHFPTVTLTPVPTRVIYTPSGRNDDFSTADQIKVPATIKGRTSSTGAPQIFSFTATQDGQHVVQADWNAPGGENCSVALFGADKLSLQRGRGSGGTLRGQGSGRQFYASIQCPGAARDYELTLQIQEP